MHFLAYKMFKQSQTKNLKTEIQSKIHQQNNEKQMKIKLISQNPQICDKRIKPSITRDQETDKMQKKMLLQRQNVRMKQNMREREQMLKQLQTQRSHMRKQRDVMFKQLQHMSKQRDVMFKQLQHMRKQRDVRFKQLQNMRKRQQQMSKQFSIQQQFRKKQMINLERQKQQIKILTNRITQLRQQKKILASTIQKQKQSLKSQRENLTKQITQNQQLFDKLNIQAQDSNIYKQICIKMLSLVKIPADQFKLNKQILITKVQQLVNMKQLQLTKQQLIGKYIMKVPQIKEYLQKCEQQRKNQKKIVMQVIIQNLSKSSFDYADLLQIIKKLVMLQSNQGQQILAQRNRRIQQHQLLLKQKIFMKQQIQKLNKCLQDYKHTNDKMNNEQIQKQMAKLKKQIQQNIQTIKQLTNQNNTLTLINDELKEQNCQLTQDISQLESQKQLLQQQINENNKISEQKGVKQEDQKNLNHILQKISNLLKIQVKQLIQNYQIIVTKVQQLIKEKDQALTKQLALRQFLRKTDYVQKLAQKCARQRNLIQNVVIQNIHKATFTFEELVNILKKCDMLSNKQDQQLLNKKKSIIQQNQHLRLNNNMKKEIDQLKKSLEDKNEQINKLNNINQQNRNRIMQHEKLEWIKMREFNEQNCKMQKSIHTLELQLKQNIQIRRIQAQIMKEKISKLIKCLQDQKKLKDKLNSMNQENCLKIRQLSKKVQSRQKELQLLQKEKLSQSFISEI